MRDDVRAYGKRAEELLEDALLNGPIDDGALPQRINAEAAFAILEHEQMHQETLLYMFHEMPYEMKRARPPLAQGSAEAPKRVQRDTVRVPAGEVTLGACDGEFCWDNEVLSQRVPVAAFEVDRHN